MSEPKDSVEQEMEKAQDAAPAATTDAVVADAVVADAVEPKSSKSSIFGFLSPKSNDPLADASIADSKSTITANTSGMAKMAQETPDLSLLNPTTSPIGSDASSPDEFFDPRLSPDAIVSRREFLDQQSVSRNQTNRGELFNGSRIAAEANNGSPDGDGENGLPGQQQRQEIGMGERMGNLEEGILELRRQNLAMASQLTIIGQALMDELQQVDANIDESRLDTMVAGTTMMTKMEHVSRGILGRINTLNAEMLREFGDVKARITAAAAAVKAQDCNFTTLHGILICMLKIIIFICESIGWLVQMLLWVRRKVHDFLYTIAGLCPFAGFFTKLMQVFIFFVETALILAFIDIIGGWLGIPELGDAVLSKVWEYIFIIGDFIWLYLWKTVLFAYRIPKKGIEVFMKSVVGKSVKEAIEKMKKTLYDLGRGFLYDNTIGRMSSASSFMPSTPNLSGITSRTMQGVYSRLPSMPSLFSTAANEVPQGIAAATTTSTSTAGIPGQMYSLDDVLSPFKGKDFMKGGAPDLKHGTCLIVYSDLDFFEEYPIFHSENGVTRRNNVLFTKLIGYINVLIRETEVGSFPDNKIYKNRELIKRQIPALIDIYTFKNVRIPTNVKRSNRGKSGRVRGKSNGRRVTKRNINKIGNMNNINVGKTGTRKSNRRISQRKRDTRNVRNQPVFIGF